jgi:membrane protease YdiL (CAAX protease family)
LIAFGLSWLLWGSVWLAGIPLKSGAGVLLVAFGMWGPGLSALIVTRRVFGESWRTTTLDRLGRKRYYLWAWLLPAAGTAIAALLTVAFGVAALDPQFLTLQDLMNSQGIAASIPPEALLVIQTVVGVLLAPLVNAPFTVGEEIGWRGFLLPRLMQLGIRQWPALLISGAVWGLWHAPIVLQGHNYPDHPYLGIVMMTVFTMLLAVIFGWLQLASGSVWVPAAAHGALNGIAGVPILILSPHDATLGGTLASIIGWIPIAVFVAWLVYSRRVPVRHP